MNAFCSAIGVGSVGWAKPHTQEEAQRLVDQFQHQVSAAIVTLASEGVDPALMGKLLVQAAVAVVSDGGGAVVENVKEMTKLGHGPAVTPTMDPEIASKGGYGPIAALKVIAEAIREMVPLNRVAQEMHRGVGFIDTNGPGKFGPN